MQLTRYLVVTRWSCRDNGKLLSFYRSHVRIATSAKIARAEEREHNASRQEMRDEGWRSRVVHTVDLPALAAFQFPRNDAEYEGQRIEALDNHDPRGANVRPGDRGTVYLHHDTPSDRRMSVRWDKGGECMLRDSRGVIRFGFKNIAPDDLRQHYVYLSYEDGAPTLWDDPADGRVKALWNDANGKITITTV